MTEEEQVAICRQLAVTCMWGQSGIANVLLDGLDRNVHAPKPWREVYAEHAKSAERDAVGVITDREELNGYLRQRYWLTSFDDDGCSLFNPPPMNGLARYVSKELAGQMKRT